MRNPVTLKERKSEEVVLCPASLLHVTDTYSIGFWPGWAWLLSEAQTPQSRFPQKLGTRILFPPLQYQVEIVNFLKLATFFILA